MSALKHYVHPSLVAGREPVEVTLIGAGGTGSQLLSGLARMHQALKALGSPGLHVRVFDGDTVSASNVGRQLFSPSDIGKNKAVVLVTRLNLFFGTAWEAYHYCVTKEMRLPGRMVLSAVDDVKSRSLIGQLASESGAIYWLDTGNTTSTGQVILGTLTKVCPAGGVLSGVPSSCPRPVQRHHGGGIGKALSGPELLRAGVPGATGPLRQPVGGHLRPGDHLEDVPPRTAQGPRRLCQPLDDERKATASESGRVGGDGMETSETEEERGVSKSSITNSMT